MKDQHEIDRYLKAQKQVKEIKGFYIHLTVYLLVNLFILYGILRHVPFRELSIWSFSTAFFWGIGLLFHGLNVFGKNIFFSKSWEERKIKELMEKDKKEYWE